MRRARRGDLVPIASILCLMLLGLAGCDGSGGERRGTAQSTSRLTLQILTADQSPSDGLRRAVSPAQTRQAVPTSLQITVTGTDITKIAADCPIPDPPTSGATSACTVTGTEEAKITVKETSAADITVTVELRVPTGNNRRIAVIVSRGGVQILRSTEDRNGNGILDGGEDTDGNGVLDEAITVNLTREEEPVTIPLESVFSPEPVSPSDLTNKAFTFADGAAFNVTGPAILTFGPFVGNKGLFVLDSGSFTANGSVTIPATTTSSTQSRTATSGQIRQTTSDTRCDFSMETSTYPSGQGPQAGDQIPIAPCATDATDGRLIAVNAATGRRSTSAPPTAASEFTAPNTVRIASPRGPAAPGRTFTVPVGFNAGASRVVSYLFELTFDPRVVEVVDIEGIAPFDGLVTNPAAFAKGVVKFAANNATFTPASGVLFLAAVTFRVVGSPGTTSALRLAFPPEGVLVDDTFRPIRDVTFDHGSVGVQ